MLQYVALAATAGLLLPLQSLINARAASYLGGPLSAAFINFAVGLVAIVIYLAAIRFPIPPLSQVLAVPLWGWVGGLFGAFFIFVAALVIPKLGTSGLFGSVIAAQLIGSLALDHFGVLHEAHPIDGSRLAGTVFLAIGVFLILRPAP